MMTKPTGTAPAGEGPLLREPARRRVLVASADAQLRERLQAGLSAMRWQVRSVAGGAAALACLDDEPQEAVLLGDWLPDLEVAEFARTLCAAYPAMEILRTDGSVLASEVRSPRRHELLHAIREAQREATGVPAARTDTAAANAASILLPRYGRPGSPEPSAVSATPTPPANAGPRVERIGGLVGESAAMRELVRLIRLVAPRTATVLIEGETGTGKELVAQAVRRLSTRSGKPYAVLNCAAIPESLLEAELFGHARGAFTGAVQARTGRIEAAHGGTLFLDEIGEMPLALQAKLLRFLECGELQRVGENEIIRVDVRVIAATHQHLEERAAAGSFRLDLFHRIAVFPIEVPALRERREDIPLLVEHFLEAFGRTTPRKRISSAALAALMEHTWPGNVRELAHVLERATILAEEAPQLGSDHIRIRRRARPASAFP